MPSVAAGPLHIETDGDQRLHIGWSESDWFGPGGLVGLDAGAWRERADAAITLETDSVRAQVRALPNESVVVLRLEAVVDCRGLGTGEFAMPSRAWHFEPQSRVEGGEPDGLRAFGYQYTEFALPVFSDDAMREWRLLPFRPSVVMPLGAIARDGRTVLLAPLDAFHEQVIGVADDGLRAGWHGDLDAVSAGFATELAVIAGNGPRECFATWARLLRAASGVAPSPRNADALGTRISYWTDNGSAYWYRTEPDHDTASTIVAAVDDLEARGVRVGAVQLDSWWYPHEVARPFDTDEWVVPPTGMVRWEPREDVLPDGIAALRERLRRRPLVAHCRHLSAKSSYADEFALWTDGDRAHPETGELYERLLDQAVAWGVEVFEHDWLIECFLGVRQLRAAGRADAWQRQLDAGLRARNMHAQWCMASPADFAQATRLERISSIRTSGDHGYLVGPELLWAWFLHTNVMARALGLWPYKDVFRSAPEFEEREVEALLSALSAGPVGVGDRVGHADIDLIRRTCRADGVLVRPDVPIAAVDDAVYAAPVWSRSLLVASAHTNHSAGRWGYVVTCNVTADKQQAETRVMLSGVGEDRPATDRAVVYDWRRQDVDVVSAGAGYVVTLEPSEWDYRVLAPVLAGDIAIVGDPALYASAGDTRIADVVADDDSVTFTVLGAGEEVTIVGWAARRPDFRDVMHADFDSASGRWEITVRVGPAGWTRLTAVH